MNCPFCKVGSTKIMGSVPQAGTGPRRKRQCDGCSRVFWTVEWMTPVQAEDELERGVAV